MKKIQILLLLFLLISFLFSCQTEPTYTFDDSNPELEAFAIDDFLNQYSLIAHAGGGIDSQTYLNSLECLEYHYNQGTRIFEIDFRFSSDDELIGVHYWEDLGEEYSTINRISLAEYEETLIRGNYTGITYQNLLSLLQTDYQDVLIVLDTKETNYTKFFNKIVSGAAEVDINLLHHFIPQLYDEGMYDDVESIFAFDYYIYTLYKTNDSNEEVYEFLETHEKISILTVSTARIISMDQTYLDSINALNRYIFVHTVNTISNYETYLEKGVTGIYTDIITENTLTN